MAPNNTLNFDFSAARDNAAKIKVEDRHYVIYGVDGEGYWDVDEQSHIYDMVSIGGVFLGRPGRHVSFWKVMQVIQDVTKYERHHGYEPLFAGYFLNYDHNQWFAGLDDWTLENLTGHEARKREASKKDGHHPLRPAFSRYDSAHADIGNKLSPYRYRIDWHPEKWFSIAWPDWKSTKRATGARDESRIEWERAVKVFDMAPAFGTGFIGAVEQWLGDELTDDDRQVIDHGKANRSLNMTRAERAEIFDEVAHYNRREIKLLERLCWKFYNTVNAQVGGGLSHDLDEDADGDNAWTKDL